MKFAFKSCGALILSALFAASGVTQVGMSVETYDDLNNPVPGTRVIIEGAISGTAQVRSERSAATPRVAVPPATAVVVSLAETSTPNGTTLGQKLVATTPVQAPGGVTHFFDRLFHQPMIVSKYITTEVAGPIHADQHDRWRLQKARNASRIGFQAEFGMLLRTEELEAFAYYNAVNLRAPSSQYKLGFVVRSRGTGDLGLHNLVLILDCKGHNFGSMPVVDCYILRRDISTPTTPPTLEAKVIWWEGERAFISLGGVVEPGDNLILVKASGQAQGTLRLATQPPAFVAGPNSSEPLRTAAIVHSNPEATAAFQLACANPTPCTPECPSSVTGECTPSTPSSDQGCPDPVLLSTGSGVAATPVVGSLACGGAGDSTSFSVSSTKSGSVNIHIKWIDSVETDLRGEYSRTSETTQHYTYTSGESGCGQCKQICKFTKAFVSRTQVKRDGHDIVHHSADPVEEPGEGSWTVQRLPCAETLTIDTQCSISGTTIVTCSQTDGPP
ncbi:MAG: hypothetical protein SGI72_16920 [Planctomycetota bacterium]|nr:hypothetical protein [Planctomycetota bacterium]